MFHTLVPKDFKAKQINQRNTRTRHFCRHHSSFYRLFVLKSIHTKMLIWQSENIKPENTFNIRHQMPTCLNFVFYVYMSHVQSSVFIRSQNVSFFKTCTLVLQVSQELKLASLWKVNNCILYTACVSFFLI